MSEFIPSFDLVLRKKTPGYFPDGLRVFDDFIWILKFLEDFKGTFEGTEVPKCALFLDLRIDAYEGKTLMVSAGWSIQRVEQSGNSSGS